MGLLTVGKQKFIPGNVLIKMDIKKFEKDMAVFGAKNHRLVNTYLTHLFAMGWTLEDAKTWVKQHKEKLLAEQKALVRERKAYEKKLFKCPLCSTLMNIYPVNVSSNSQTGDKNDKSVWVCSNNKCMETIYNTKTVEEILSKKR